MDVENRSSTLYHGATTDVADLTTRTGNDAFQPQVRSEIIPKAAVYVDRKSTNLWCTLVMGFLDGIRISAEYSVPFETHATQHLNAY